MTLIASIVLFIIGISWTRMWEIILKELMRVKRVYGDDDLILLFTLFLSSAIMAFIGVCVTLVATFSLGIIFIAEAVVPFIQELI